MLVYDSRYTKIDDAPFGADEFDDKDEAIEYILNQLPHEDLIYMVGTARGIVAMVFQGSVYVPEFLHQPGEWDSGEFIVKVGDDDAAALPKG